MVPPPPPRSPQVVAKPQLFRNPFNATREILVAAKAALKALPKATDAESREIPPAKEVAASSTANVEKDAQEHNYVFANPPSPVMQISIGDIQNSSMEGNTSSGESQIPLRKKAKLVAEFDSMDTILSSSPDLPHKQPRSGGQQQDDFEDAGDSCNDNLEHSMLFGVQYIMWFEIGIEQKDPMDKDEDDWGGRLEFGFIENNFSNDVEDYFLLFKDQCTQSHT